LHLRVIRIKIWGWHPNYLEVGSEGLDGLSEGLGGLSNSRVWKGARRAPSVPELQELGVPGAVATIAFFARLNCGYNTGGLAHHHHIMAAFSRGSSNSNT
jgi:hypothetical protein